MIRTKPASDPKLPGDGYRILIEPAWPRGLPKGKALGADWMRGLYPSRELRDWMRANPRKANGFRERYLIELAGNEAAVDKVSRMHRERGDVTILTVPSEAPWDLYEILASFLRATCD